MHNSQAINLNSGVKNHTLEMKKNINKGPSSFWLILSHL